MSRRSAAVLADERALRSVCGGLRPLVGHDLPPLDDVGWEQVIAVSSRHLVTPALGWTLRDRVGDPDVQAYFSAMLSLNERRNAILLAALPPLLSALNDVDAQPVLMKGAAVLAEGLYPAMGARLIGDIDILVAKDRLGAASDALRALGYRPDTKAPDFAVIMPDATHHLPVHVHESTGVGIELHWQFLAPPFDALLPVDASVRRSVAGNLGGERYLTLDPTDKVVLNVAHAQLSHGLHANQRFALRQLLDLARLDMRHGGDIDWSDVGGRFRAAGHADVLANQAYVFQHLFGRTLPFASTDASVRAFRASLRPPASRAAILLDRAARYARSCVAHPHLLRNVLNPKWLRSQWDEM